MKTYVRFTFTPDDGPPQDVRVDNPDDSLYLDLATSFLHPNETFSLMASIDGGPRGHFIFRASRISNVVGVIDRPPTPLTYNRTPVEDAPPAEPIVYCVRFECTKKPGGVPATGRVSAQTLAYLLGDGQPQPMDMTTPPLCDNHQVQTCQLLRAEGFRGVGAVPLDFESTLQGVIKARIERES